MKIKMLKTVRDTMAPAGTVLYSGSIYKAEKSRNTVLGVCMNGQKMQLQDGEWEEVSS